MGKHGIDISEYQGCEVIQKEKPSFCLIHAYFYDAGAIQNMRSQILECDFRNIPFGLYLFCDHRSEAELIVATRYLIDLANEVKPMLGLWIDLEPSGNVNVSAWDGYAKRFCEIVEESGYYAGIYCSSSYLKYFPSCDKYDKWVAEWHDNFNAEEMPDGCSLWQYTDSNNTLDRDYCKYDDLSFYNLKGSEEVQEEKKEDIKDLLSQIKALLNKLEERIEENEIE